MISTRNGPRGPCARTERPYSRRRGLSTASTPGVAQATCAATANTDRRNRVDAERDHGTQSARAGQPVGHRDPEDREQQHAEPGTEIRRRRRRRRRIPPWPKSHLLRPPARSETWWRGTAGTRRVRKRQGSGTGAARLKASLGVTSSSTAPPIPPATATGASARSLSDCSAISRPEPGHAAEISGTYPDGRGDVRTQRRNADSQKHRETRRACRLRRCRSPSRSRARPAHRNARATVR